MFEVHLDNALYNMIQLLVSPEGIRQWDLDDLCRVISVEMFYSVLF